MGTDFSNKPNLTKFSEGFRKCRGRKLDHRTHPGSGLCGTVQWPQLHGKVGKDQTWGSNFSPSKLSAVMPETTQVLLTVQLLQ